MLSGALRALFLWLSNRRWMARVALATPLLRRMPLRFVAGTTLDSAVAAVRALNADGASATLDVLGESVSDRASAERAAAAYVATIERIAADEHRFLDQFARHHIDRPADVAVDDVALTVGG